MRKIVAIALLLLFLFNTIGYWLLFNCLQQKAGYTLAAAIEKKDYDENDLVTIKVPLHLPYESNWKDYEEISGKMEVGGKIYHYVKRKVSDGQLILLCLPGENENRLQTARDDFFKIANNLSNPGGKKQTNDGNNSRPFQVKYQTVEKQNFAVLLNTDVSHPSPQNDLINSLCYVGIPEKPPCFV